jgi:hypothetical protein
VFGEDAHELPVAGKVQNLIGAIAGYQPVCAGGWGEQDGKRCRGKRIDASV